ncbi:MAG: hypothetical protein H6939_01495 [Burkholderiales bacterium]|nr:hypothetical protein [Burkholderiales bacterium]
MTLIILLSAAAGKKTHNVYNPRVDIMTLFLGEFPPFTLLGLPFISQWKNPFRNRLNTAFSPVSEKYRES